MRLGKWFGFVGITLIALGLLAIALIVAPQVGAQEKIVKYGTMHPLTGAYSVLGRDQQRATERSESLAESLLFSPIPKEARHWRPLFRKSSRTLPFQQPFCSITE